MDYDSLRERLQEYKQLTESIIESLNKGDYSSLDEILAKRGEMLDCFKSSNKYNIEEAKAVYSELNLIELEIEANDLMEKEKEKMKTMIEELFMRKNANNSYNNRIKGASAIFSKKV